MPNALFPILDGLPASTPRKSELRKPPLPDPVGEKYDRYPRTLFTNSASAVPISTGESSCKWCLPLTVTSRWFRDSHTIERQSLFVRRFCSSQEIVPHRLPPCGLSLLPYPAVDPDAVACLREQIRLEWSFCRRCMRSLAETATDARVQRWKISENLATNHEPIRSCGLSDPGPSLSRAKAQSRCRRTACV